MKITVLNTEEELKSFPITQSINLKIDSDIEKSNLKDVVFLIRNKNETGLFNFSNKYNQSLGYIKEKFSTEDIDITTSFSEGSTLLNIKPIQPLSPGFEYTLIVYDNLSKPYISFKKTISSSPSHLDISTTNEQPFGFTVEIMSNPSITNLSNIVKATVTDLLSDTKQTLTLDLKKSRTAVINSVYSFNFSSDVYVKGEVFTFNSQGLQGLNDNFFLTLKANITENIKPIGNENKRLTTEELLSELYKPKEEEVKPSCTFTYSHNNRILVTLSGITTSELDLENIQFNTGEAFNMYTLSNLGLYDITKRYSVVIEAEDQSSFYIVVKEL